MEFAATREALASLYHESPVATLLCNRSGRIVSANAAAARLFDCSVAELIGRECSMLVADARRLEYAMRDAVEGRRNRVDVERARNGGPAQRLALDVFQARIGDYVAGAFVHVHAGAARLEDVITGLPDRALFDDRVEQTIVTSRRYRNSFALMHAEIDGFEEIDLRFGSSGGDEILRVTARRIREVLRRSDTVARTGAHRFAVLQPMIDNPDDAVDLAHKIVFAMQAPMPAGWRRLDVRLSIGIAVFPTDGETNEELTVAADRALVEAKHLYRGLFRLATNPAMGRAM